MVLIATNVGRLVAVVELTAPQPNRNTIVKNKTQIMRTKAEIERSLAEMKRMADDARRGLAKAKEMNATVLVKHFEQWETKCEARAEILSWVLDEQDLSEDIEPQLPQADVMCPLPPDYVVVDKIMAIDKDGRTIDILKGGNGT